MPIIYQYASEAANAAVDFTRKEQAQREAEESEDRILKHLDILTAEAWGKAGSGWAQSTHPEHKSPSISMAVEPKNVAGLKVALRGLGYTHVTEKHVPECKERGYLCDAYTEVRVFVEI